MTKDTDIVNSDEIISTVVYDDCEEGIFPPSNKLALNEVSRLLDIVTNDVSTEVVFLPLEDEEFVVSKRLARELVNDSATCVSTGVFDGPILGRADG